jgi:hypothetical protein
VHVAGSVLATIGHPGPSRAPGGASVDRRSTGVIASTSSGQRAIPKFTVRVFTGCSAGVGLLLRFVALRRFGHAGEEADVRRTAAGPGDVDLLGKNGSTGQRITSEGRPCHKIRSAALVRAIDDAFAANGSLIRLRQKVEVAKASCQPKLD